MEYYLGHESGDAIAFQFHTPGIQTVQSQLKAVSDALMAFSPLIQPIAIDLWLGCREANLPYLEANVLPTYPGWFIYETSTPPGMDLHSRIPGDRIVSTTPEITESALMSWFDEIIGKSIPPQGYLLALESSRIEYTRLCVEDKGTPHFASSPTIRMGQNFVSIPCIQRNHESWAAGPIEDLMLPAPATVEFLNHDGNLAAYIHFNWRGILRNTDTWAKEVWQEVLQQMALRGWTLTTPPEELGLV